MSALIISRDNYSYKDFQTIIREPVPVRLSEEAMESIHRSHTHLVSILKSNRPIYGVTTGFGKLSHVNINPEDQKKLQLNLVRSHASGVGKPIEKGIVRVMMFLKLLTFSKGYSGVRKEIAQQLIFFLNENIIPFIPEKGSVGASGDLAPLAHLALPLIGEGKVFYNGKQINTDQVIKKIGINPLILEPKEGISLINGTQYSTAIAINLLIQSFNLLKCADIIGALSVESSMCSRAVFNPKIHALKSHEGQNDSAKNIWTILADSKLVESHKNCGKIQDPYSFRCIPHVHGASRDVITHQSKIVNNEINSVSDNPLIFSKDEIYSSGHFHGEHIAQAMDSLGIALSEIGAISQKRIHYFMKGIEKTVPPFLALNPGLESGYMLAQVTAAALASENKTLSHPASVDSLTTSAGQEDFVSMAPWAGQKAEKIAKNTATILAIELMINITASTMFFKKIRPARISREVIKKIKPLMAIETGDRPLDEEIYSVKEMITSGELTKIVENIIELN